MIDKLDQQILLALINAAKTSYAEMAQQFHVSIGTIHVRIEKMRQNGIIEGTNIQLNHQLLGFDICCFIGVNFKQAADYSSVVTELERIPAVIEAYYTTGSYSILLKVLTQSMVHLREILIDKIQSIAQIQSTETLIVLDTPLQRPIQLDSIP